jgi:hypothetical protein
MAVLKEIQPATREEYAHVVILAEDPAEYAAPGEGGYVGSVFSVADCGGWGGERPSQSCHCANDCHGGWTVRCIGVEPMPAELLAVVRELAALEHTPLVAAAYAAQHRALHERAEEVARQLGCRADTLEV